MAAALPLVIGTNEYALDHEMPDKLRSQHLHVLGATGTGKSRFLLSLILQDIKNRTGLCLIDPHGELVGHVVDWLAKNEHIAKRRKIRVLDLKDQSQAFGFNPLKASSEDHISATVDQAANALASVMGGTDLAQAPLLRMTLNAVCTALSYAGLTLNEAPYLLSPNYPEERRAITASITNPTYAQVWENYNFQADKQPKLYLEQFQPAERRFIPFIANQFVRSILGQNENVLDLRRSMDEGEILLVDLSRTGGLVPSESTQIIGRLLVNSLVAKAYERPPGKSRAFNLYIDEVQNFLSGDVPEILSQCRKFGLHLTIANQYLQQLREAGELIYHGVMGTARNKVCFALDNPEDAEIMSRRIFSGHYDFEKAKTSMNKPVVVGHEIVELKTRTAARSEAITKGIASAEAMSYMESQGYTESQSSSQSQSQSHSIGTSHSVSYGEHQSQSQGQSTMNSSGVSHMSNEGVTHSDSMGEHSGAGMSMNSGSGFTIDQNGNPVMTGGNLGMGENMTSGQSMNSGVSHSANHGTAHHNSSGYGTNSSQSHGTSRSVTDSINESHTSSFGSSETQGHSESFGTSKGSTSTTGHSEGVMQGTTATEGVSQALKPILEERPSALYSLEELKHQFADEIIGLPNRSAYAVLAGKGMAKITTLDVPDLIVSGKRRERIHGELKIASGVHKPPEAVHVEITERFRVFMESSAQKEEGIAFDPMNPMG